MHRMAQSKSLITGMPINLLNLQAHLRKANSTSPRNTLDLDLRRRICEAMAATLSPPRILPSGDSAITVEFSRNIDDAANRRVLALDRILAREPVAGVTETVPTYRSLLVHYDPLQIGFDALSEKLVALALLPVPPTTKARRWRIPVVYGGEHGIDLEDVAKALNTTPDEIVARHVAGDYRVAMIGFTPGWSYLSGLDPSLHMPRRQNPRLLTPAGTVSIGGVQTGVQCLAGPSGWHLLGRTPVRTYQLHRDPIFLLEPGDRVTFSAIDARTFAEQDRAAEAGEIVAELIAA
jgi:KipI family sensor histidine kinase inhibitor